mgnify:CR=1 FL=1
MVVDDTAENLKLLDGILEGGHHEVRLFSSGAMMLKAAAKDPPDLVLLDVLMPEMDGYEVCRRMRGEAALHDVPVLFLSALSDVKSKVKAFEAGGMDYVTKPFQIEEVTARVKTHLLLRRTIRELDEHRRDLERLVREKMRELSDSQFATITALSKLAESRDDESGYHVERTRAFCGILCGRLSRSPRHREGMTEEYIQNLCGASVLHDEAIFPVREADIPIHIKNTNAPDEPGTLILPTRDLLSTPVVGVAGRRDFTVIHISKAMMNKELGVGRRVLGVLETQGINFEHMPSGIDTMSVVVATEELADKLDDVIEELRRIIQPDDVQVYDDLALITTVGLGMAHQVGIASRCFGALSGAGINVRMISQGVAELNIIVGVQRDDFEPAVRALYEAFVVDAV